MISYERFRDLTEEYRLEFHRRRLSAMASHIQPGETVLDVGCNGGYFAEYLPEDCIIHGLDPSAVAIEVASSRLASAQLGVAEALPFADKSVDVVVLGYVLERVKDPNLVLREACRVARRAIVGDTPHELGPWGPKHPERHPEGVLCQPCATLETLAALLRNFARSVEVVPVIWGSTPAMYSFFAGDFVVQ